MYELNGIIYAGETTPELKVTTARVTNDWMMLVTFSNGILTWDNGRIDIGTNNLYDLCYPYDTIPTNGNDISQPRQELVH